MSTFSKGFNPRKSTDRSIWDPICASLYWVYGSIIIAWLLNLLPWSQWPFMPNLLAMTLVFWAIYQPQKIFYWLVFLLGLMLDTETAAVFGQNSLALCLMVFCTELMHQRLQWLQKVGQAINILPVFLIPPILLTFESFCFGDFRCDWTWFAKSLMCVLIWPFWSFFLSRRFISVKS